MGRRSRLHPGGGRKPEKGQVAKSQELNTALLLLGMALLLGVSGEWAIARLAVFVRQVLGDDVGRVEFSLAGIQGLHSHAVLCIVVVAGPVMGTALALGLFSQFLQVGFNFTTEPLTPQLNRLNPVEGAKRIFSKRAFVELLKSCLKIAIVAYVAYSAIGQDLHRLQALLWVEPVQAAAFTMEWSSENRAVNRYMLTRLGRHRLSLSAVGI